MTTKEKNQIVHLLQDFLECATQSQRAVNYARDQLINFIETNIENKYFQDGINFAVEVIADEIGDDKKELLKLFEF